MTVTVTATTSSTNVQVRELPAAEWWRLEGLPDFQWGLPDPHSWRIIVAEEGGPGGRIIGYNGVYDAVHSEPCWIDPAHRHHPGVFRDLWRGTLDVLEDLGEALVHVCVSDELPKQQALVEKMGFVPAPGKLYVLDTRTAKIR